MIARLQRTLVFAALLSAALLTAWAYRNGWPMWTCAGVALVCLLPHAPVLALEFAFLSRLGRDGSAPVPTARQLLGAWAHEVLHGLRVFAWRQPFRAQAQADLPGRPGLVGVLLVHGFVCNRGLWAPWLARFSAMGVPCRAVTLEPAFGSIDAYAATLDAAVAALQAETGHPPLVVGHSMGGLALRAWLRGVPGAADRVARVVTIGTPHHGTWLARWAFSRNGQQMRMGSAWLQTLAADEARAQAAASNVPGLPPAAQAAAQADPSPPSPYARFTCFYGHCDNIVFPPGQAMLPGADNRHLPATAHVQLAFHPAVWALVQALRGDLQAEADARTPHATSASHASHASDPPSASSPSSTPTTRPPPQA